MVEILSTSLQGSKSDTPFDAGLTRYELWVGKKASTTRDQQGRAGGWAQPAWFFDAYNVVNQAGRVLGEVRITTADSKLGQTRAFRNSPYIVEATETPLVRRTFTKSQDQGGSVRLSALPKMLVLHSPDGNGADGLRNYTWGSTAFGSALSTVGGAGRVSTNTFRAYRPDAARLNQFGMGNDNGRSLAPNKHLEELMPVLATNWHNAGANWVFRSWQRAEDLLGSVKADRGGKAFHRWILETKSDLLYAPNQRLNPDAVTLESSTVPATPEQLDGLTELPKMVVGLGDIQGFDTGGFRILRGGNANPGQRWTDPDSITDSDGIAILPIGRFYPESAIVVAVQYSLLNADGTPQEPNPNRWKTAKLFYWNSSNPGQVDPGPGGPGGVWQDISISQEDSMKPRRIQFGGAGATFDPYTDAWIISIRDLAHTSAVYKIRVFMALPFKHTNPIRPNGGTRPASLAANGVGALPANASSFGPLDMAKVLAGNHLHPTFHSGASAVSESLAHQPGAFRNIVSGGLAGGSAWRVENPSGSQADVAYIDEANDRILTRIIQDSQGEGSFPAALRGLTDVRIQQLLGGETAWFEYLKDANMSWTVDAPQIDVGLDESAAGTIITE
jgi:hypothetical protein